MDTLPVDPLRRILLRRGGASLVLPFLAASTLIPRRVLAGEWNRPAFTSRNLTAALRAYGVESAGETREIAITAPEIAENGAKVEIEIACTLPDTRTLAVFAEKNPMPLCAALDFAAGTLPYVRLQLKLAETTRVRVVARTGDGKHHVAWREIKVTLGGCGA